MKTIRYKVNTVKPQIIELYDKNHRLFYDKLLDGYWFQTKRNIRGDSCLWLGLSFIKRLRHGTFYAKGKIMEKELRDAHKDKFAPLNDTTYIELIDEDDWFKNSLRNTDIVFKDIEDVILEPISDKKYVFI